jgi:hypothetical protein
MDPLTLLALGSTALSSIAKLGSGFASSSLAQFQAGIANANAALSTKQAGVQADEGTLSLDQGALQQSRTIQQVNETLGGETGKFAASGLDPTYGSPLMLEGFTAGQGATDLALIGAKAQLGNAQALETSAGTMAQAASETGQAAGFGMQATDDVMNGILGAAAGALGGLSANGGAQWNSLMNLAANFGSGGGGALGNMVVSAASAATG